MTGTDGDDTDESDDGNRPRDDYRAYPDGGGDAIGEMELDELREEIRTIDHEIVELVAQRTYVADTIARVKERRGMATTDEEQERRVMERAGENAERFGLDANMVKAVFRLLIELNKIEQRDSR